MGLKEDPTFCFRCGKRPTTVKSSHVNFLECKKCKIYFLKETVNLLSLSDELREGIEKRYSQSFGERFYEVVKSIILFPFEFIVVCLILLVSPFNRNKEYKTGASKK